MSRRVSPRKFGEWSVAISVQKGPISTSLFSKIDNFERQIFGKTYFDNLRVPKTLKWTM